jgi:hypothetical protein
MAHLPSLAVILTVSLQSIDLSVDTMPRLRLLRSTHPTRYQG